MVPLAVAVVVPVAVGVAVAKATKDTASTPQQPLAAYRCASVSDSTRNSLVESRARPSLKALVTIGELNDDRAGHKKHNNSGCKLVAAAVVATMALGAEKGKDRVRSSTLVVVVCKYTPELNLNI